LSQKTRDTSWWPPWKEAYRADLNNGGDFQHTFVLFFLVFAALNLAGNYIGKRQGPGSPLSTRPTFLAGTFHALATSVLSIYFSTDCIWYCYPRSDVLIFVHHIVICFCHYPAIDDGGATLAGVGDASFSLWLSERYVRDRYRRYLPVRPYAALLL
jgi:hypothetical protein